jgi:hypothetical protein
LGKAIEITGEHSGLDSSAQAAGIDLDPFHSRKVYNEAAVANTMAREAVATRPNCGGEVMPLREFDRTHDIINVRATDNYFWVGVHRMIPDAARPGILLVARQDDTAFQ